MSNPTLEALVLSAASVRSPYFFNGRLLSREDLAAEHTALRSHDRQLGRVLGSGVACGFAIEEKSRNSPVTVTVSAGLALNECGTVIELAEDILLELKKPANPSQPVTRAEFDTCDRTPTGAAPDQPGAYLLTVSPYEITKDRAPVSGLGNLIAPCNAGELAEALQFRLVPLVVSGIVNGPRAQNQVAWQCLGGWESTVLSHLRQPFVLATPKYGLRGELSADRLTKKEVPLAVVYWSAAGVFEFVDMWAARRRVSRSDSVEEWALFGGDRRLATAESAFWQFQGQIESLIPHASLSERGAAFWFDYLPAGGFLPIGTNRFNPTTFFAEFQHRQVDSDPALLRLLLAGSWHLEALRVPTASTPAAERSAVEIHQFAGLSDFVFFLRTQPTVAQVTVEPEDLEQPEPQPEAKGRIAALVELDPWPSGGLKSKKVKVAAYDKGGAEIAVGKKVDLNSLGTRLGELKKSKKITLDSKNVLAFLFEELPTGKYTVTATFEGYLADSATSTVTRNGVTLVELKLTPRKKIAGPRRPDRGTKFERPVEDLFGNKYGKFWPVPEWWMEKDVRKILDQWGPRPGCDPRGPERKILEEIFTNVLEDEGLPTTPGDFEIFIDPGHRAGSVAEGPYAVAVFANGGGIPLVLVPVEGTIPTSVAAGRSGIPELESSGAAMGLGVGAPSEMDVVAALWTGLAAETLGISLGSAHSLLEDTAAAVETTLATLTFLPGVSAEFGEALSRQGLNAAAIANQTVEQLGAIAQRADLNVSDSALGRIIDHARQAVPAESWSLGSGELGLSEQNLAALEARGIDSLGQLEAALGSGREALGNALGLGGGALSILAERVGSELISNTLTFTRESSLNSLEGLTSGDTQALIESGITSVTGLAMAPVGDIAMTLGITDAQATAIVRDATTRTVADKTGMSRTEASRVVVATGVTHVDEFDSGKVAAVKTSLGSEAELRTGQINLLLNLGSMQAGSRGPG